MECIQVTAKKTLPNQLKQRKRQENWFTAAEKALQPLIKQKVQAYRACKVAWEDKDNNREKDNVAEKEAIYKRTVRQAKLACQLARERYYSEAEADLEALFNSNNMFGYYQAVSRFITPKFKPICTSGQMGGLVIPGTEGESDRRVDSPEEVLGEWKEYFSDLLNQKCTIQVGIEHTLREQLPTLHTFDELFSMGELTKALRQMGIRKAPGVSGIPVEAIVWGTSEDTSYALLLLYNVIWTTGQVPQAFRDSIITMILKSGDPMRFTNYRGLCLNEHQGKIFERLIANRLILMMKQVPQGIPDSQCGFVPGKSTMNASFVDRSLSSGYRASGKKLYKYYVDLTKAYDRVFRELLWKILYRLGVPPLMLAVIRGLHDGARGQVRWNGQLSDWFRLTLGLRQGAVFSPILFNIFFGEIIRQMRVRFLVEGIHGAKIAYRRRGFVGDGLRYGRQKTRNVEHATINI